MSLNLGLFDVLSQLDSAYAFLARPPQSEVMAFSVYLVRKHMKPVLVLVMFTLITSGFSNLKLLFFLLPLISNYSRKT